MVDGGDVGSGRRTMWSAMSFFLWSFGTGVALTYLIGFYGVGWQTAGQAQKTRIEAVQRARSELAAEVCAARFMEGGDARQRLATFQKGSAWGRSQIIRHGGWAVITGLEDPITGVAPLCVRELMEVKLPMPRRSDGMRSTSPQSG